MAHSQLLLPAMQPVLVLVTTSRAQRQHRKTADFFQSQGATATTSVSGQYIDGGWVVTSAACFAFGAPISEGAGYWQPRDGALCYTSAGISMLQQEQSFHVRREASGATSETLEPARLVACVWDPALDALAALLRGAGKLDCDPCTPWAALAVLRLDSSSSDKAPALPYWPDTIPVAPCIELVSTVPMLDAPVLRCSRPLRSAHMAAAHRAAPCPSWPLPLALCVPLCFRTACRAGSSAA